MYYCCFGVEYFFIYVDIDNLCIVFYLLVGYIQCFVVFFFFDQVFEFSGIGDVGVFIYVYKQVIFVNVQWFQVG